MILRRRVSLNSIYLDEIDPRIVITGIDEMAGRDNIDAVDTHARSGQRIARQRRGTLDVAVRFTMNIRKDDMQGRSELLEAVNTWASGGGYLRLNYRKDRRLNVMLAQAPGGGDMYGWTNEFQILFRAYRIPFWEDEAGISQTSGTNKTGNFIVNVPGNTETVADFLIENRAGATIKEVTVKIGNSEMKFADSSLLPAGGTLELLHGGSPWNGLFYLVARVGTTSKLKYRTGANDFYVSPGDNTVTFSADRAIRVTANVRGRYL